MLKEVSLSATHSTLKWSVSHTQGLLVGGSPQGRGGGHAGQALQEAMGPAQEAQRTGRHDRRLCRAELLQNGPFLPVPIIRIMY